MASEQSPLKGTESGGGDNKAADYDETDNFEDWGPCEPCCAEGKPCRPCANCCRVIGFAIGCHCCCCEELGRKRFFLHIEKKDRFCTDVPCCMLLLVGLFVQFIIVLTALTGGADIARLVHGADYNGTVCKPGNSEGKLAAWPDIRMEKIMICLDRCRHTLNDSRMVTPPFNTDLSKSYNESDHIWGYKTVRFMHHCVPDPNSTDSFVSVKFRNYYNHYKTQLDSFQEAVNKGINDFLVAWPILFGACIGAALLSVGYSRALREIADLLIWASIILVLIGIILISTFLIKYSHEAYKYGYDKIGDAMYYGGYILLALDGMYFLAVLFMIRRIQLAVALAKETTRALSAAANVIFYPVIPFLLLGLYFLYWVFGALVLVSVSEKTVEDYPAGVNEPYYKGGKTLNSSLHLGNTQFHYYHVVDDYKYAMMYHFFILLWVLNFFTYHSYMVVSGIYAEWYFADWADAEETSKKRGEGEGELSNDPLRSSAVRTNKFHLGTVSYAALLVAIVQWCDTMLTYFEKKLMDEDPTFAQKALLAVIHCLLKCLACIIDRINEHGIIVTAIYGWPLCAASSKGLALVFQNVVRAAALDMVSGYLTKIGQFTIIAFNCGITVMVCRLVYGDHVSSLLIIVLVAALITWAISWQFLLIFDTGINTIFMCFLIDEERNKGGHMRASHRLQEIIGETKVKKRDLEDKAKGHRGNLVNEKQRNYWGKSDEVDQSSAEKASDEQKSDS